jgi:hypothetical protein
MQMLYNQPLDQPSNPNAPYIDGNPKAGIQGSIVPAASIEFDQREVVEVITRANARGYSDFSGTPCAPPGNQDMQQLRKAIEGFITGWSFIIDTTITFKVHGAGYDFIDLNAAFSYLRKYYITSNGHVILQLAGAAQGATTAVQYTYTVGVTLQHPNGNRISIFGAKMLAPCPPNVTGYAINGSSPSQRAADASTNLAMLRTKFATELHFVNGGGMSVFGCPNPMHFDALLLTSDGGSAGGGTGLAFLDSYGPINSDTYSGIACVNFLTGMFCELGATVMFEGPTAGANANENFLCPIICVGTLGSIAGAGVGDGSYLTMSGNLVSINGAAHGFLMYPRSGCQMDGAVECCANVWNGVHSLLSSTVYIYGPLSSGTAYRTSHMWRNGQWGISGHHVWCDAYADFSGNGAGSIYAEYGSQIHPTAGDQGVSSTCSPPWGTIGNGNANIQ